MAQHAHGTTQSFSLFKQTDASTTITDARLNKITPIRDQQLSNPVYNARVSDLGWFGKGFPFATFSDPLQKYFEVPSAVRSGSDLSLLWALSQVMGADTITQPDAIGSPNTWQHVITWQDIVSAPEPIYTTILEEVGGGTSPGWSYTLEGMVINSVTLSGNMDDHVTVSYDGFSRNFVTNSTANPPGTLTTESYFKTQRAAITYGAAGSPATISAKVISWSVTFNRNASRKWRAGQPSGQELLMARADVGQQEVSCELVLETEDTFQNYMLNDTTVELNITLSSEDQVDSADKTCLIELPNMKVGSSVPGGLEDFTLITTQSMPASEVLQTDGDPVARVTITSDIDNTEALVDGSV